MKGVIIIRMSSPSPVACCSISFGRHVTVVQDVKVPDAFEEAVAAIER